MKVGIVFGGNSYEHEISIVSAIAMKKVLSLDLEYIFLDKGEFYHIPTGIIKSKLFSSGEAKTFAKVYPKSKGFYKKGFFGEKNLELDIVLNLTHGGDGEDGKLASLFDIFEIPYIGPRVEASVMSYNKFLTKLYANSLEVNVLEYVKISNKNDKIPFAYPIILKPLRLGSSIGVSVIKSQDEFDYAFDVAYEFDKEILIEPFIAGVKEYNLAGFLSRDGFEYSIIEEPQKKEFLDFDKKYLDFNRTERVTEADIPENIKTKLKENFAKLYNTTFMGAIIRCDFFEIGGEIYLNEINPIPGSMANYLFDNFESKILKIVDNLPTNRNIPISYQYLHSISSAKGKAN